MVITGRTGHQYEEIAEEVVWKHIPDRHMDVVGKKQRLKETAWVHRVPGLNFLLTQLLARSDDAVNFLPHFLQQRKKNPEVADIRDTIFYNFIIRKQGLSIAKKAIQEEEDRKEKKKK